MTMVYFISGLKGRKRKGNGKYQIVYWCVILSLLIYWPLAVEDKIVLIRVFLRNIDDDSIFSWNISADKSNFHVNI